MPELPDIELYRVRLAERLVGSTLEDVLVLSPFVLRSIEPSPQLAEGNQVIAVERLGKRIVIQLEDEIRIVIHLLIAGRLQWVSPAPSPFKGNRKIHLISFRFSTGQLTLVEASTKKRASVYFVQGMEPLENHRRAGLNVLKATLNEFEAAINSSNRTLKRALTDPNTFDGIGNAYSDEILFHARLSPVRTTSSLSLEETKRLLTASQQVFETWIAKLATLYSGFPKPSDITAFRPEFATHGRFGQPCPVCDSPIQRIVYAENETNYCAKCQNEGRLLADRSLSRLLRADWPKTLEEMLGDR